MQSIKINSKTKEKIEQTQAELLLKHNQKVSQSELLEKIVEKAVGNQEFMEDLFQTQSNVPSPPRIPIRVKIVSRKKPDMRLFPDEWED